MRPFENKPAFCLAVVALVFFADFAMAARVIDFEAYQLGNLIGQDSWFSPTAGANVPVVDSGTIATASGGQFSTVLAGSKCVLLSIDNVFASRPIVFDPTANTAEVSYIWQVGYSSTANNYGQSYFRVVPTPGNVGEIQAYGDSATGGVIRVRNLGTVTATSCTFLYTDILSIRSVIDFAADTYTVYVSKNGQAEENVGTFIFGLSGVQTDVTPANLNEMNFKARYGGLLDNVIYSPETPLPIIATNPLSQLVDLGQTAAFSVSATNAINYTWYHSSESATPGEGTVVGTNSPTLTITDAQIENEGYYSCVVSNASGNVASNCAMLMTKRLISRWDFENNLNDSVSGYNGSRINAAVYGSGIVGTKAIQLDGYADDAVYVNYSNKLNLRTFTVSAWAKNIAGTEYRAVVSTRKNLNTLSKGYMLWAAAENIWTYWTGVGTASWNVANGPAIANNQWVLLTASYDDSTKTMKLYFNGVLYSSTVVNNFAANDTYGLLIGAAYGNSGTTVGFPFTGLIDDVRYYSYALEPEVIAHLYADVTGQPVCVELPQFDFSGNCIVDMADFVEFAQEWLTSNIVYPAN